MSPDMDYALAEREAAEIEGRRPKPARHRAMGLRHIYGAAMTVGLGALLFFLILPTVLVIPMSLGSADYLEFPPKGITFKWYVRYLTDPDWIAATLFSLKIALVTTATATIIGTLAAIALVRGDLPGKAVLQAVTISPMIVPHIVIAVSVFVAFAPLKLSGNFVGFLIAHTMLAVPYVVLTVTASLQRFDTTLELAALNCGAGRSRAFFSVVLPGIAPGVSSGAVFAFLASFDEATVAFFLSGIEGKTITRKMFEDIDFNLTPVVAAVSTIMVLVSLLVMGGLTLFQKHQKAPSRN
ncbi:Polyamine ABC transporter, permease protein [Neorhizobium galegae bv. orientalis]|nr:Polyamine ABC transporter, permease protein [Neorhizobium galegae bv. orientalis]